ncbi:LruC domain-containing protein [Parabacteroides bouchesdurhonensis]|uniref:LruC domain-containing protein n=1 Tax=Parabacteroides bouchesdurhonensis TaxID=1936995 RepID=UPI000C846659|nr:LruC domain-containing protein [Parabacteroides bouchesdurhonensis]
MKSIIKVLAVFFVVTFSACTKDVYDAGQNPDPNPGQNGSLPGDFTWSLSDETELTVNIEGLGEEKNIVEAYIGNPATDPTARLIAGSQQKVNNSIPYVRNISIPTGLETIYIRVTDSRKRVSVYGFDVIKGHMVCNIGTGGAQTKSYAMSTRAAEAEMPQIDYSYEGKTLVELTGSSDITLQPGTVYIIPKDQTFNGQVSINGGGDILVYVEGTWQVVNSFKYEKKSVIYVLDGGKVETSGNTTLTFVESSMLAVQKGGQFGDANARISLSFNTSNNVVNEGLLYAENLSVTDKCSIYNSGDLVVTNLSTATQNNYIVNKSKIKAESIDLLNGVIDNYCHLVANQITTRGQVAHINLFPSSYVEAGKLSADHLDLFMDAKSMWKGESASFAGWDNKVRGGDTDWALLKINTIEVKTGAGKLLNYSGMVNIECKSHTEHPSQWNPCYGLIAPANFSEGQGFAEIDPNECNGNGGNHNPGEEPGPDDDITETNTLPYTYLFEDNWPQKGDYDMNDIVMSVTLRNTTSASDGKVKALDVDIKLYAVGARKKLAVAFQLDGVPAGAVSGSESNQQYAVIRLFDDAHAELGGASGEIINTYKYDNNLVKEIHKQIKFNTPLDQPISVGRFNLFAIWGDADANKRYEVHIPGFRGTNKAMSSELSTDVYTSTEDGWMWGLCVPFIDFSSFPKESVNISEAYSGFDKWISGDNTPNWYLNPIEGKTIVVK